MTGEYTASGHKTKWYETVWFEDACIFGLGVASALLGAVLERHVSVDRYVLRAGIRAILGALATGSLYRIVRNFMKGW